MDILPSEIIRLIYNFLPNEQKNVFSLVSKRFPKGLSNSKYYISVVEGRERIHIGNIDYFVNFVNEQKLLGMGAPSFFINLINENLERESMLVKLLELGAQYHVLHCIPNIAGILNKLRRYDNSLIPYRSVIYSGLMDDSLYPKDIMSDVIECKEITPMWIYDCCCRSDIIDIVYFIRKYGFADEVYQIAKDFGDTRMSMVLLRNDICSDLNDNIFISLIENDEYESVEWCLNTYDIIVDLTHLNAAIGNYCFLLLYEKYEGPYDVYTIMEAINSRYKYNIIQNMIKRCPDLLPQELIFELFWVYGDYNFTDGASAEYCTNLCINKLRDIKHVVEEYKKWFGLDFRYCDFIVKTYHRLLEFISQIENFPVSDDFNVLTEQIYPTISRLKNNCSYTRAYNYLESSPRGDFTIFESVPNLEKYILKHEIDFFEYVDFKYSQYDEDI